MIRTIVDRIVHETDLAITVLLSPITPGPIGLLDQDAQRRTSIVRCAHQRFDEPSEPGVLRRLAELLPEHTHVLIIAPESDGILTRLVRNAEQQIAQLSPGSVRLLNLNSELTAVFSDKQQTCFWLNQHGLPTIPTWTVNELPDRAVLSGQTGAQSRFVAKPRDGVGSDRIRILNRDDLPKFVQDHAHDPADQWIIQPYVEGTACSCGLIGLGSESPHLVLPLAYQQIINQQGELRYVGGSMPAQQSLQELVAPVMNELQQRIGAFYGYVGIDLLVNPVANEPVQIVEVNPRICTSIVGYFNLFEDSLARVMIGRAETSRLRQRADTVIRFHADETFRPTIESSEPADRA